MEDHAVGMALGYGSSQKFGGPFNIYTMAEASDFKFGTQLGFAEAHHKTTRRGKVSVIMGYGSSPKCCGSTSIFT